MSLRAATLAVAVILAAGAVFESAAQTDTDGDSLPDAWEVLFGKNPADSTNGVSILVPELLGAYDTPGCAQNLRLAGDRAWLADGAGGLVVLDVSTPTNPTIAGSLAVNPLESVRDVCVSSTNAYLAVWGLDGGAWHTRVTALDASDPGDLQVLSTTSAVSRWLAWSVDILGNTLYVGMLGWKGSYIGNYPESIVRMYDVTDPSAPVDAAAYYGLQFARDVEVTAARVAVADMNSGVTVFETGAATNAPRGQYATSGFLNGREAARAVHLVSNTLLVAYGTEGLHVLDVTSATNPVLLGTRDTPGIASGVASRSNIVFVADGEAGLAVLDVRDPAAPAWVTNFDTAGSAEAVWATTDTVYVADGTNGFLVMRFADDDTDRDGMSDAWETARFASLTNEANGDVDADGISNLGEYRGGLDPLGGDQDHDGLPDGWEVANLLDPATDDAAEDPDGDGQSNRDEFIAGTSPQDTGSVFRLGSARETEPPDGMIISWLSTTGRTYHVERSSNLFAAFSPVASNIAAAPPENAYTDWIQEVERLFYRVRVDKDQP